MNEISLDQLSASRLGELVGTGFDVTGAADSVIELQLTAVEVASPAGAGGTECFSITFDGPAAPPLAQRTYRFTHAQLGWFDLFIVPVGAAQGRRQYEAVFNRSAAPDPARRHLT